MYSDVIIISQVMIKGLIMISDRKTTTAIKRLVEVYSPLEVYVFGSFVWGSPSEYSDLDILVIIDQSNEKVYKRPIKGIKALKGLKIPKDIIVYTRDEFDQMSQELSSLCYKIKNEGRKVYEAA
jgi:predicted nucleotidyltransferase